MENLDPSRVEYWLERAKDTGGYFIFFRNYGRILSKEESLFLQDLINRSSLMKDIASRLKGRRRKSPPYDEEGYFRCTSKFLMNPKYLPWSIKDQKRLFAKMLKLGFISIRKRGSPQKRWVKINYFRIEEALDEVENGG